MDLRIKKENLKKETMKKEQECNPSLMIRFNKMIFINKGGFGWYYIENEKECPCSLRTLEQFGITLGGTDRLNQALNYAELSMRDIQTFIIVALKMQVNYQMYLVKILPGLRLKFIDEDDMDTSGLDVLYIKLSRDKNAIHEAMIVRMIYNDTTYSSSSIK